MENAQNIDYSQYKCYNRIKEGKGNMNFEEIAKGRRNSIKRAIARFCFLNKVNLSEEEFNSLVRRTQRSGYKSAVKFIAEYFKEKGFSNHDIRRILYSFTIEYNTENYCREFPQGNKAVDRILTGNRLLEDEKFFKETLYDIVKANKLQISIINDYTD